LSRPPDRPLKGDVTYASERAGRAQAGSDPRLRIEHVFDSVIDVFDADLATCLTARPATSRIRRPGS